MQCIVKNKQLCCCFILCSAASHSFVVDQPTIFSPWLITLDTISSSLFIGVSSLLQHNYLFSSICFLVFTGPSVVHSSLYCFLSLSPRSNVCLFNPTMPQLWGGCEQGQGLQCRLLDLLLTVTWWCNASTRLNWIRPNKPNYNFFDMLHLTFKVRQTSGYLSSPLLIQIVILKYQ